MRVWVGLIISVLESNCYGRGEISSSVPVSRRNSISAGMHLPGGSWLEWFKKLHDGRLVVVFSPTKRSGVEFRIAYQWIRTELDQQLDHIQMTTHSRKMQR